jgi:hypothetical protein
MRLIALLALLISFGAQPAASEGESMCFDCYWNLAELNAASDQEIERQSEACQRCLRSVKRSRAREAAVAECMQRAYLAGGAPDAVEQRVVKCEQIPEVPR